MDLIEIGINTRNWVNSGQDRNYWRALVNATQNFRVPQAIKLGTSINTVRNQQNIIIVYKVKD